MIPVRHLAGATWVAAWLLAVATPQVAAQALALDEVVASALATHPAIAASSARGLASDQALATVRASRLPGIAASGMVTRFGDPMVVAPIHSLDPNRLPTFDETLIQGHLTLQYTIFDGGSRGARIRQGTALAEAARLGVTSTEMEVVEGAVAAFVGVLTARAVLEAADAQLVALQEEQARVERNLEAGTAAEVELLRAAATLQDARAQQSSAAARVGLAERGLARAAGIPPDRITDTELVDVGLGAADARSEATSSPLVEQARSAVAAAEASLSTERSSRLPRVDAVAGVSDFASLGGNHEGEWQAGVQLSWPVFTGGATTALARRAQAEVSAARSDLAATRLRVAQEVDVAETAVAEARARAVALELAVTQWAEVSRIERLALSAGSGVQGDLLRAQAGLFQARAGLARARYDAVLARVRLAKARGELDPEWIDQALEIG